MRRILISEAGGALSNGTIESLRRAPEPFHLVGVSSDVYGLQLADTDEKHLVPSAGDPDFVPVLNQIVTETGCELIMSQHDSVVRVLSRDRDQLAAPVFLPAHDVV